ncbi:hypothetical protein [Mangrovicoccus ximenensis]|uniref:hypothetical protein n=1 Tax=Mangrovicoccus ximenensis TaxID=1911570 RepID=UPI001374A1C9|nr:hypothetical protein [Mangrovicoccus ximenensis]
MILLAAMFAMFQAVFAGAASAGMSGGLTEGLVADGAIAGGGSVIVFLPQILILENLG